MEQDHTRSFYTFQIQADISKYVLTREKDPSNIHTSQSPESYRRNTSEYIDTSEFLN